MKLFELVDALRALERLGPEAVAGVVGERLTPHQVANPHWRVWQARIQDTEAGFDVELWVPNASASSKQGRVMLRPHELTITLGSVESRYGKGTIGRIIPEKGEEGVVNRHYDDDRQRTTFQTTHQSHALMEVVIDRQEKSKS